MALSAAIYNSSISISARSAKEIPILAEISLHSGFSVERLRMAVHSLSATASASFLSVTLPRYTMNSSPPIRPTISELRTEVLI